ncbi:hypothetical protein T4B_11288 [Trichinella pseudospiralis]|uniref:PiggyBac transposable element-derived protein domain-containing protein n=2 Tax=Trichinella pseudospiralis TaxID=6337 RepID=A0A0V1H6I7_TRIPS|nr:hypothetical protein T4A_5433 [Trichinella pseudospiralis]KRY81313.1 hypothetical protein T4D_15515 [Trichinella pseudospiralis]KRZ06033.1 hypothetical protein T4B_11288 [Trichinella pseudospiralis]KRZ44444.1 hypothetical protein T4C_11934 [Trichinella pseudospiralis]
MSTFAFEHRSGELGLANTIVEQLTLPFLNSNRNVFINPHFTSYSILQYLLEHGLIDLGTVSAHRRDVPAY